MGISVLSNAAAPIASASGTAGGDAPGASLPAGLSEVDFAALLARQVLGDPASPTLPVSTPLSADGNVNSTGFPLLPPGLRLPPEKDAKERTGEDLTSPAAPTPPEVAAAMMMPSVAAISTVPAASQKSAEAAPSSTLIMIDRQLTGDGGNPPTSVPRDLAMTANDGGKAGQNEFPQQAAMRPLESANFAAGAPTQLPASSPSIGTDSPFAAALAAQQAGAAAHPARQALTEAPAITARIGNADWNRGIGDSIVWMNRQEVQSAQLNLNPPHLGPLQINLSVSGDQVNAVFGSPHAEVRQAIQDALPQLKEMLAGVGINLGNANIGAQLQQQQQAPTPQASHNARFTSETAILQGTAGELQGSFSPARGGRGLVDLFA